MQSFLGEYPGARSNPDTKFIRAVNSFKNQVYQNNELIIVADGCDLTKTLYEQHFADDPSIRLIYLSRNTNDGVTYEAVGDSQRYFRGYPRQIGVAAAMGDLISYMDSDDMMMVNHTLHLMMKYKEHPGKKWFSNRCWYDNAKSYTYRGDELAEDTGESFKIPGLDEEWVKVRCRPRKYMRAPWVFAHIPSNKVKWRDVIGNNTEFALREDADFISRFIEEHSGGVLMDRATYVRCHHVPASDIMQGWDC